MSGIEIELEIDVVEDKMESFLLELSALLSKHDAAIFTPKGSVDLSVPKGHRTGCASPRIDCNTGRCHVTAYDLKVIIKGRGK